MVQEINKDKKNIAIAYLAGGISSRFGGKIKQFAVVGKNGETLIEYSMNQAIKSGFSKIIFIVSNKTEIPFKERFGNSYKGIPIEYAVQEYNKLLRERPWGTADAVCTLRGVVNEPFVICNGDNIFDESSFKILIKHLQESENEAAIGYPLKDCVPEQGKVNRGTFSVENNYVTKIVENLGIGREDVVGLGGETLCNANFFAFHPGVIDLLYEKLIKFKKEHEGDRKIEALLPVHLSELIEEGKIKMKIYPAKQMWLEITNPGDEEVVRGELAGGGLS
jgi:NDP-sugar pyrophosphorylase family protein